MLLICDHHEFLVDALSLALTAKGHVDQRRPSWLTLSLRAPTASLARASPSDATNETWPIPLRSRPAPEDVDDLPGLDPWMGTETHPRCPYDGFASPLESTACALKG